MQNTAFWNTFHGANAAYVQELYDRYLTDPSSVDAAARRLFATWRPPEVEADSAVYSEHPVEGASIARIVGGANWVEAIRERGHLQAMIDPLGSANIGDPSLDPSAHGIQEDDLRGLPASLVGGPMAASSADALEAVCALKSIYMHTTGYDFDHVREPAERTWLREAVETRRYHASSQPVDGGAVLQRLTEVEAFEQFIHRIFPGKHRFSIEGLDMMVPMLDEIISSAAQDGVRAILFGMAHRGRLNMLAHTLGKSYASIFAEFKDPLQPHKFRDDLGWMGDVKYHLGASRALRNGQPTDLFVTMAPNPSHLEFVNPVVQGMARAAGTTVQRAGAPVFNPNLTLPILIHGDAAFPGQGIVAETLNLARLPGYWTGGTIHVIANNQLGYTTEPQESRSTIYASDLAKGFKIPIIHVNADDPEACMEAARLAFGYLQRFQRDFVIDLYGYRRYGHNEGDEPMFTQPKMYRLIEEHPTVRSIWAAELDRRGVLTRQQADQMLSAQMEKLQGVLERLDLERDLIDSRPPIPAPGTARRVKTAVPAERLRELNAALLEFPQTFTIHPKLARVIRRRLDSVSDPDARTIDWSQAEDLAMASILADGISVRLTGQDVERGTFSQRHAVFHDFETGQNYVPLQALPQAKAAYEIHNSPLSEAAVVGFEYGYNVQAPERLVLWEAQYGDFNNGAQVIIDEFITSARAKWGQTPSLVLLLPHGYEGAGPDHSSARLERFLQMAAETNMRVAYPTTAAQYFHLLRRQALLLKSDPLPLIVMTPKSLLRQPLVSSSLRDLAEGAWRPILEAPHDDPASVSRLMIVCGKISVDIASDKRFGERPDLAFVRVEQIYPFPSDELARVIGRYPHLQEVVWVQEEPENMGAWEFARPLLGEILPSSVPLRWIARARNSSPSEGSAAFHAVNQTRLLDEVFALHEAFRPVQEG